MSLIEAQDLVRLYHRGSEEVRALAGVSFTIEPEEFVAIVGPSGSGKSTLLQLLGGMDRATSGSLLFEGRNLTTLSDAELTRLRRDTLGFVFQDFGLLPVLTVEENIALPHTLAQGKRGPSVDKLLEQVGLTHRRHHRPMQLSGGEMQRVAVARALVGSPRLLLADEPTGNLDAATGASILALLQSLHAQGLTVVVVTHNPEVAACAGRCLTLRDGRLVA